MIDNTSMFVLPPNLDTPVLVGDVDRLNANIDRMAQATSRLGVTVRPHVKTHKSWDVARLQLAAGATGLTVATLGEAEVFADGGFDDLFIAYPLWAAPLKADRLRRLAERVRLRVSADSPEGAALLADCLAGSGAQMLVEVDSGNHRSGTTSVDDAVRVADAAGSRGLEVVGVFTHGGHSYAGHAAAPGAAANEVEVLEAVSSALLAAGHDTTVVSAGSTPTALLSARGQVTEQRPGTYVYNDRLQVTLRSCTLDDVALAVAATVVSHSGGRFVLDAGAKVLSKDLPSIVHGYGLMPAYPDAVITRLYDHHAVVEPGDSGVPRLGEVVAVIPNHVCPVIDLAESVVMTQASEVVAVWPVHARGRSR